jgi:hypothetical protein
MRRLIYITAFALFLALPLWAQRGGGHVGGGHGGFVGGHGGFSGGHASFSGHGGFGGAHGGGHFSGGMRGGFSHGLNRGFDRGFNHRPGSGFSRSPYLHNEFHRDRFNRGRFRGRDRDGFRDRFILRNNCFGFGCWGRWNYPWWAWGYDPWPWDWWDDHSSYDDDYYQNLAIANEMNQQSLEQQRMMREEEADGDQDSYATPSRSAPESGSSSASAGEPILPATVLVFRDQHQQEIRNYAIVGQILWNFASQHTQRIPLADLDLAATEKANDDRGVSFRVPSAGEGQ